MNPGCTPWWGEGGGGVIAGCIGRALCASTSHIEGSGPVGHSDRLKHGHDMLALITVFVVLMLWWLLSRPRKSAREAPGPRPWPLIGSLHLLGGYETPFQAFTVLSKIYGNIFSIDLGSSQCVVVTSFKLIKEVLILKGGDFGGRPDFIRFHKLFGGDRNNCK